MTSTSTYRITPLDEAFLNLADQAVMSIQFEIRVAGRLDYDTLSAALRTAVTQHQFARARLAKSTVGAVRRDWEVPDVADHLPLEVSDESLDDVRSRLYATDIALSTSPPFAATLVRHDEGDHLLFNFHHAVFDGISVLRFLTSVARAYTGDDDPVGGPELEKARDLRAAAGSRDLTDLWHRVSKIAKDFAGRLNITRMAADGGDDAGPRYAFAEQRFDAGEVAALRDSKPEGVTLNDVMLAALALAVVRWNREHDEKIGDTVSIMMPVNIRPSEWSSEVVSNFASYLGVIVPTDAGPDLMSAAETVRDQTKPLKENGAAGWIVDVLEPGKYLPSVVKRGLGSMLPLVQDRFVESTTLSNLGRSGIPEFGAAGAVTEVWFSPPPLSAVLPLAIGVCGVGDELFVSFRSDRRHIGADGARAFAETFGEIVRSV